MPILSQIFPDVNRKKVLRKRKTILLKKSKDLFFSFFLITFIFSERFCFKILNKTFLMDKKHDFETKMPLKLSSFFHLLFLLHLTNGFIILFTKIIVL